MDYYHVKNEKQKNNRKEIQNKLIHDVSIKSYFSDQTEADQITPLSKAEECALKKVRRKLKNKISAQESRKRKKQHLENLEKRVRLLDSENNNLKKELEKKDQLIRSITFQLKKLKSTANQETKAVSYQNQATQTGVCLKCYLQKQPVKDGSADFKVQTAQNGRIVVQSDFLENYRKSLSISHMYTDFNSLLHGRSTV